MIEDQPKFMHVLLDLLFGAMFFAAQSSHALWLPWGHTGELPRLTTKSAALPNHNGLSANFCWLLSGLVPDLQSIMMTGAEVSNTQPF